jgi:hypothetical protein
MTLWVEAHSLTDNSNISMIVMIIWRGESSPCVQSPHCWNIEDSTGRASRSGHFTSVEPSLRYPLDTRGTQSRWKRDGEDTMSTPCSAVVWSIVCHVSKHTAKWICRYWSALAASGVIYHGNWVWQLEPSWIKIIIIGLYEGWRKWKNSTCWPACCVWQAGEI